MKIFQKQSSQRLKTSLKMTLAEALLLAQFKHTEHLIITHLYYICYNLSNHKIIHYNAAIIVVFKCSGRCAQHHVLQKNPQKRTIILSPLTLFAKWSEISNWVSQSITSQVFTINLHYERVHFPWGNYIYPSILRQAYKNNVYKLNENAQIIQITDLFLHTNNKLN